MPAQHDQLFARVANFQALHAAALRAVKGKRKKPGAALFFANLEREVLVLERQLREGKYRPGRYVAFEVNDPKKKRIVSAAPFRDQVVHHAFCAVVEPIFDAGVIANTSTRGRPGFRGSPACLTEPSRARGSLLRSRLLACYVLQSPTSSGELREASDD